MNEPPADLECAVRERLARSSEDVPDVNAMRQRVLAALEQDTADLPSTEPSFWARNRRPAALLSAAAAVIAAVAVLLPRQPSRVVVAADEPTTIASAAVESAAPGIGISDIRDALSQGLPQEDLGRWFVRTPTDRVLDFEFVPDEAERGDPSQFLRIVASPEGTTADEVVDSLTSSLFDTNVVVDSVSRIGDLDSRTLRLETVGGTTSLGFKLASDTYLQTEGIDRVFVVHLTTAHPAPLVFWIEAGSAEIDGFEPIALRFIEALSGA